ncbi:AraC family transcriptional regulator [Bacterioplanoides sp.]|uniref:AraC family transcriptional regulator n=1 Tax=Bacterioplanoides sp. TaxID=2066072 RepID=UPI003AFFC437
MIKELLEKKITQEGINTTGMDEVILVKLSEPVARTNTMLPPGLCLVGQGEKHIYAGEESYVYNKDKFLLGTIKLPVYAELKYASKEKPYLGMVILLNPNIISELLIEFDQLEKHKENKPDGLITNIEASKELYDLIARLISIIGNPQDEKILGPQYLREIYYYLLKSTAGPYMRNCVAQHSKAHQLAPIIHFLENNILEDISIEDLVSRFQISPSSLHEGFKKATTLPPMQYLKRLRLNNSHQLLMYGASVKSAAAESGYRSVAQFSREFKRLFGVSPRDVKSVDE